MADETLERIKSIEDLMSNVSAATESVDSKLDAVISFLESILAEMPLARQFADLMPTLTGLLEELKKR